MQTVFSLFPIVVKKIFWGNIWGWIDGINEYMDATTHEGTIYIADHSFADDTGTGAYEDAGIIAVYGNGYVSASVIQKNMIGYSFRVNFLVTLHFLLVITVGMETLDGGSLGWVLVGIMACMPVLSVGIWIMLLLDRNRHIGGRLVYVPSKAAA